VLKETEDKIYYTNSYGQTITVKKETLKGFAFSDRMVEHVFPEVAETIDRLFSRQAGHSNSIVSPLAVSLELGVNINTVCEAMKRLEEMGILKCLPSKSLQIGSISLVETSESDRIYSIIKEHSPSKRI